MRILLATAMLAVTALAQAASDIQVMQPKAFATPPGAPTGLVMLSLHNTGASADVLLGAKTPLAGKVEIHSMTMTGGVMSMRPLDKVPVPIGALVEFKSGGNHLMLVGLPRPLVAGTSFPLTLVFQKAGEIRVNVPVLPLNAR